MGLNPGVGFRVFVLMLVEVWVLGKYPEDKAAVLFAFFAVVMLVGIVVDYNSHGKKAANED
jgi:hypothetical protein